MVQLFTLLAQEDESFPARFSAIKPKKKTRRRYLAPDKGGLYAGRIDLEERYSVEIAPGWWLGTNYSRPSIQEIINLALEVAGPGLRRGVKAKVL